MPPRKAGRSVASATAPRRTLPKRAGRQTGASAGDDAQSEASTSSQTIEGMGSGRKSKSSSATNRRHPMPGRGNNGERVTRSSGARLTNGLEHPAQVEKELNAQLRNMRLYAVNTMGDGNCLFRALSDQFYGFPDYHAVIREEVCDYLAAKPEKFAGFLDVEKTFEDYVRGMRTNGTYGGHLELSAFSQLFQKEIKIMQPGLVYIVSPVDDSEAPSASAERERREAERQRIQQAIPVGTETPLLSDRDVRRRRRERKASNVPIGCISDLGLDASTSASPSASTSKAVEPQPKAAEAWGPLYIAYHNWEHYSSIRNVDGPHKGLPRIKERPASNASQGGPIHEPNATSADAPESTDPTSEEELLMRSTDSTMTVTRARFYIRQHGSWENALEAWQAAAMADAADAELQAAGEMLVSRAQDSSATCLSPRSDRSGSVGNEEDAAQSSSAASVDLATSAATTVAESDDDDPEYESDDKASHISEQGQRVAGKAPKRAASRDLVREQGSADVSGRSRVARKRSQTPPGDDGWVDTVSRRPKLLGSSSPSAASAGSGSASATSVGTRIATLRVSDETNRLLGSANSDESVAASTKTLGKERPLTAKQKRDAARQTRAQRNDAANRARMQSRRRKVLGEGFDNAQKLAEGETDADSARGSESGIGLLEVHI
ncbi:OTU (ovarian tumor)-like cysteine protease [Ceraceosorus bombacis]|uniref:OTU (Ovarian tumor)-like cysteine protease n=1 Tax=Ceraceosorus bombacis TaxID=401625 RepID=A0A0P1BME5_9BASI|nr:OTU (ovarian tumor)-like cysteine protease [Ceraceosorus bombacis]